MYNDDRDDKMEDAEEEEEKMREGQEVDAAGPVAEEDLAADTDRMTVVESVTEVAAEWSITMEKSRTPQENRLFSPPLEQQRVESKISRSGTLTIRSEGEIPSRFTTSPPSQDSVSPSSIVGKW